MRSPAPRPLLRRSQLLDDIVGHCVTTLGDEVVDQLLQAADGACLVPNYPAAPVTRIVCSHEELVESADALSDWLDSMEVPHLVEGIERGKALDLDQVLMRALEEYDRTQEVGRASRRGLPGTRDSRAAPPLPQSRRYRLEDAFHAADSDGNGALSMDEFVALCDARFPQLSRADGERLFVQTQQASERIDPAIGDALLPEAFIRVAMSHPKLSAPRIGDATRNGAWSRRLSMASTASAAAFRRRSSLVAPRMA